MRARQIAITALILTSSASAAELWSRFRGPNGTGIATGTGYPVLLNPEANAIWQTPVRPGKSSPVLTDEAVFLTAYDQGKLYTQCFDRRNGRLLWERAVERQREAKLSEFNEPASHTPVTDGESVYVMFRDVGLLSYDAKGQLRWLIEIEPLDDMYGHSASPVLAGGRLIVTADQMSDSYITAVDTTNGKIVWRVPREEHESWATPAVYGDEHVITTGFGWLGAHRAADGKRLWGLQVLSPRIVASPVVLGDRVYTFGHGAESLAGFLRDFDASDKDGDGQLTQGEYETNDFQSRLARNRGNRDGILTRDEHLAASRPNVARPRLFAFRLSKSGSPSELWRYERSFGGVIPSPLVYQGVLYFVRNGGILESLDVETGEVLKRGRLREAIGGYTASPVAADGKIYLASEDGKLSTLASGRRWTVLATSDLGEEIFATPGLSGGAVFVRTQQTLYCFGKPR